jgi:TPR repeat protein
MKWYRPAAAQGNSEAQLKLGAMYYGGSGVPRDYAEAVRWYRLSATHGNAEAQFDLGSMYREGNGVTSNYTLAHMWANLAAAQEFLGAAELRDQIAGKMTLRQISQAQELARRCELSKYSDCGQG